MEAKDILPIWQPIGFSTHLITQRVGEKLGVKTSHTGTLDPMAEGVIIVLLGEERLKKEEYALWKKTYEFEIAFGYSTDTFDGMGLVEETSSRAVAAKDFEEVLKDLVGEYVQEIPKFSTKKVGGKHLHEIAKSDSPIEKIKKSGEIYELDLINFEEMTQNEMIQHTISKIEKVTGDFRQKEIISRWREIAKNHSPSKNTKIAKLWTTLSKGLYVRSLSQDICKKLNTVGFAFSITRTANGDYNKSNCKMLADIFGTNFESEYDFVSRYTSNH